MNSEFVARLPDLKRELEQLERRADAIRQIIVGVSTYTQTQLEFGPPTNGNGNGAHNGNGADAERVPRGREAIRAVVSQRPGTWTLKQIVREFEKRKWPATRKAIEVSAHRLAQDGELERVRPGVYRAKAREEVTL